MVRNLDSFPPTFLKEPEAGKRKKRENQSKIRHYLSHQYFIDKSQVEMNLSPRPHPGSPFKEQE